MTDESTKFNINRRDFLRWVGVGAGTGILGGGLSCRLLEPVEGEDNPLSRSVSRDWKRSIAISTGMTAPSIGCAHPTIPMPAECVPMSATAS